jgi:L-glyceraldehyde 3-phosphate reductase
MFNRWIEEDLLDTLAEVGAGCIAFTPLAQGLLTTST